MPPDTYVSTHSNNKPPEQESTVNKQHRDELPMLLPVPYAARLLGVSRSAAYKLAETGELPSRRLGGRVYIVTDKLFRMMEAA